MKFIFFIIILLTVKSVLSSYYSCVQRMDEKILECQMDKDFTVNNRENKCKLFYDNCYEMFNGNYDSIPECKDVNSSTINLGWNKLMNRDYYKADFKFICTKSEIDNDYCLNDFETFSFERFCKSEKCYTAALEFSEAILSNKDFVKTVISDNDEVFQTVELFQSDECKNGTINDDEAFGELYDEEEDSNENISNNKDNDSNEKKKDSGNKSNTLMYIGIILGVLAIVIIGCCVFLVIRKNKKESISNLKDRDITISLNNESNINSNRNINGNNTRNVDDNISNNSKENLILNNNNNNENIPTDGNPSISLQQYQQNQFPVISATFPNSTTPQLFILQPVSPDSLPNIPDVSSQPILNIELPTYDQVMENEINVSITQPQIASLQTASSQIASLQTASLQTASSQTASSQVTSPQEISLPIKLNKNDVPIVNANQSN